MKLIRLLCVVGVLAAGSAQAQDADGWDWKITPYLWTVGISGEMSVADITQDIDVSFSDILSDMDIGGSIYAEFGKGNHSMHFDYTYLRLKPDPTEMPSPPAPPGSTLSTKMTNNIFEAAYNYRYDGPVGGAVVVGARYMDIEMRMAPDLGGPGVVDPEPVVAGPNWWDAFIGFKTHNSISDNWDFDFYGTIGQGGSDLPWTVQGVFARRFSNDNRLGLGFRVWGINYSKDKGQIDSFASLNATFYGFLIGYEFN
jgi:hypothetical protein